jgi:hypothetical protein
MHVIQQAIYFGSAYWPNSHDGGIANNTGSKQPGCSSGPDRPVLCSSPSDNCCGPWVGADLEAGMYYGGGMNGTDLQNKPLNHDLVSPMLKGRTDGLALHNAPKTGLGAPLRIPELARALPSLRCAPFKCSWCMGGIRCVAIYSFFGTEEMDFGPQRSPTSKYDFELEKRVLYAL